MLVMRRIELGDGLALIRKEPVSTEVFIDAVEAKYSASYVGNFDGKYLFYQPTPAKEEYSCAFCMQVDPFGHVYISNPDSVLNKARYCLHVGGGEYLYSSWVHDYQTFGDKYMIDGGREYIRCAAPLGEEVSLFTLLLEGNKLIVELNGKQHIIRGTNASE